MHRDIIDREHGDAGQSLSAGRGPYYHIVVGDVNDFPSVCTELEAVADIPLPDKLLVQSAHLAAADGAFQPVDVPAVDNRHR